MTTEILLATYNGEKYLEEQIDSIFSQTYTKWNLIIRDDESEDNTLQIIQKYIKKYPQKILLISGDYHKSRLGASQNFSTLLKYSTADYIFFSDQDDIWLKNKVRNSIELMRKLESSYGNTLPILIHTDLNVVNARLDCIHSSYWQQQHLDPVKSDLKHFLVRNLVTGCTVLINRSLRDLAIPIPVSAYMHDWWLALIATSFGKISYLPKSTVLYRQHTSNEVGAQSKRFKDIVSRLLRPRSKNYFSKTYIQAQAFAEHFGYLLNSEQSTLISEYIRLDKLNWLEKRHYALQQNFWDIELLRKLFVLRSM